MRNRPRTATGGAIPARQSALRIARTVGLALAIGLIGAPAAQWAPPAVAAESYNYDWDPSGIFTRSMRQNGSGGVSMLEEGPAQVERQVIRRQQRARRPSRPAPDAGSESVTSYPQRRNSRARTASRATGSPRRANRTRRNGTRVASLGPSPSISMPSASLSGGGSGKIVWRASSACLNSTLRSVIAVVAANYGQVRVNSTCRSRAHNRRVGGASRSYHLTGDAADIRIHGNWRSARSYLASAVGGFKHYGGGLFHIDTGPRRRF